MDRTVSTDRATDLGDYARRLRRHWRVVALATALGLLAGAAFALLTTPRYEASASVLVRSVAITTDSVGGAGEEINLDTQAQILQSADLATLVVQELDVDRTAEDLRQDVSVVVPPNSQVLTVTFAAPTAQGAAAGAQAYAEVYLEQRQEEGSDVIEQEVEALDSQLVSLRADLAAVGDAAAVLPQGDDASTLAAAERSILVDQISEVTARLTPLLGAEVSGGRIISPATVPESPAAPVLAIDLGAGLLLGLLVGLGAAALLDSLDHRAHRREDVVRHTGLPVLAELTGASPGLAPTGRALAAVRTSPALRDRSSTVTSVLSTESPGEVAPALAASLALAGHRSVLVVLDPASTSAAALGADGPRGLTEVLSGAADLEDVLRSSPGREGLLVLTVGSAGGDLEDLVQTPGFRRLLDELRLLASKVVVEAPSADRSAAGLVAALASEATVLVATRGVTDLDRVRSTAELVTGRGGHVEGVVLVDDRSTSSGAPSSEQPAAALSGQAPR